MFQRILSKSLFGHFQKISPNFQQFLWYIFQRNPFRNPSANPCKKFIWFARKSVHKIFSTGFFKGFLEKHSQGIFGMGMQKAIKWSGVNRKEIINRIIDIVTKVSTIILSAVSKNYQYYIFANNMIWFTNHD